MTAIAEALGMALPGGLASPPPIPAHIRAWPRPAGRRIVEMVWEDLTPGRIQTREAFENAIAVAMAMGCSTNAIIHLIAMARPRRRGARPGRFRRDSPPRARDSANVRPSGRRT